MAKSSKRAKALSEKRAAKARRMAENPDSESRYAMKKRGAIPPVVSTRHAWCKACYCKHCICGATVGMVQTYDEREDFRRHMEAA